ncbi:DUF1801 domain-containing protein [Aquimarina sp. W85]|uniref:DUF1801 domain-containing protein n=1 Tax=Aquimarina rhodophyticola TaxID=3342246 RepID=UPI00366ECD84
MKNIELYSNPEVRVVFENYPDTIRKWVLILRDLIINTARDTVEITHLEETLKWGEPSYITKFGSTLRIACKSKSANHYCMYFQCSSRLVKTFKKIYSDMFTFEGNRAIIFELDDKLPIKEIKIIIRTALTYHKVKHLPTLGI